MKAAIDRFWVENHQPPSLRDLLAMTDITSTSVVAYYVSRLPDVRLGKHGRIIPLWVDDVFESHLSQKQAK